MSRDAWFQAYRPSLAQYFFHSFAAHLPPSSESADSQHSTRGLLVGDFRVGRGRAEVLHRAGPSRRSALSLSALEAIQTDSSLALVTYEHRNDSTIGVGFVHPMPVVIISDIKFRRRRRNRVGQGGQPAASGSRAGSAGGSSMGNTPNGAELNSSASATGGRGESPGASAISVSASNYDEPVGARRTDRCQSACRTVQKLVNIR